MPAPGLLLVVKGSLLLTAALAAAWLARRAAAQSRHRLWSGMFAALLLLPLLSIATPAVRVPLPAWFVAPRAEGQHGNPSAAEEPRAVPASAAPATATAISSPFASVQSIAQVAAPARSSSAPSRSVAEALALMWIAGVAVALLAMAIALVRVAHLARSATSLTDAAWTEAAAAIAAQLGLRARVHLLASPRVATPMAGGVMRPAIFLPASAPAWTAERRDVVLAHELAHLAQRDPIRQLVSRLALSIYWFHPLAWIAARQSAMAREQACDEAVLALGTRPSTYARVLLDFAGGSPAHGGLAALPIVQRSLLEKRLMAILNAHTRPAHRRLAIIPAALAAFTLTVAAAQPGGEEQHGVVGGAENGVAGGVASGVLSPRTECALGDLTNFSGTRTTLNDRVEEAVGRRQYDFVVQKRFGDMLVCAVAEGVRTDMPVHVRDWPQAARRVVFETREGRETRRMEIEGTRTAWFVNGQSRPVDSAATSWRDRLMELLEPVFELTRLRGEVSSLQGQISSIYGQRSSLEGQISSLRGQVSSMEGEISSWQGRESALQGEISSIQGQLSAMRGQISSEHGAISSLDARRAYARDQELISIANQISARRARIAEIEQQIARFDVDARVRDVQKRLAELDVNRQIAEVEKRLRDFDVEKRVKDVETRIAQLGVERRVAEIEREISALDVERKARDLEQRIETALRRFREVR